MFSAKLIKTVSFTLILTAGFWSEVTRGEITEDTGASLQAQGLTLAQTEDGSEPIPGQDFETMNGKDLRTLMNDLAGYHSCDRLQGHILTLSSDGAASSGTKGAATGNFWVHACKTQEADPLHLEFTVSGEGWRWISRQRQQIRAQFEIDEYVKFSARVSMVGTFHADYARQNHIMTVWFVPTRPVEVDFQVLGDVDVETESLWSSIVGQGAEILGESPEERALSEIRRKGARKFRSRLSSGLTMIVDLCTGQRYTKFGTFPAGQVPDREPSPKDRPSLADDEAVLHRNGILMSGPFDTGKPLVARLEIREEGGVLATLICQEDAQETANAYTNGNTLPEVQPLAEATARPDRPAVLEVPAGADCPVVLVMRPIDKRNTPVSFSFEVYHEGAEYKPLVRCE